MGTSKQIKEKSEEMNHPKPPPYPDIKQIVIICALIVLVRSVLRLRLFPALQPWQPGLFLIPPN